MNWQPIETAPKDGTHVLVRGRLFYNSMDDQPTERVVTTAAWFARDRPRSRRGRWETFYCYYGISIVATHWMPLPAPPEAQS